jgi:hypothetical protein
VLEQLKAELSGELRALKRDLEEARSKLKTSQASERSLSESVHKESEKRLSLSQELKELRALLALREGSLKNLKKNTQEALRYLDPKTARPVDVMLVIDGTKSMQPSLDATRANLKAVIGALRIVSPSVRVGVTVYRDKRERPQDRLEEQALTSDEEALRGFLAKIKAKSSKRDRDRAEWLCGGLKSAVEARWRPNAIKLIAVVSDAATQSKGARRCVQLAKRFRASGGVIHVSSTLPDGYKRRRDVTREYDRVVLREHALIAEAGGGEHIQRADESTLLEAVLRAAFRSRMEGPIEALQESLKAPSP